MKVTLLVDREAILIPARRNTPTIWANMNLMHSHIATALQAAGHRIQVLAFSSEHILSQLRRSRPDIVFNLTLHVRQKRREAFQIAAILNLLDIPYTGSGPGGILRSSDKALSKNIARMTGVRVPQFLAVPTGAKPDKDKITLPALIKPRFEGGSEGITERSVVHTYDSLCRRVAWVHRHFQQPAVCEEFIEGREVSVGLLGNDKLLVFPIRERVFGGKKATSQFVTYRMKTDERYRERRGIHWEPADLSARVVKRVEQASIALYRQLYLRDFARIDYRLTSKGEPVFLEANHCPDCAPHSFGMFARWLGADYQILLHSILSLCMERNGQPLSRLPEGPTLMQMTPDKFVKTATQAR